jgi:ATP-dependent helicase/nuclease subunit B
VVGDIERTRLDNVKVMFFVGVNDGIIPKKSENTSVLSETDRQFFEQLDVTLSPSARQKAFIQKFYLYLIMTKPSEKLYLSYSGKSSDGKSVLPSYLIRNLKTLYPQISVENAQKAQEQLSYIRIPKADILWSQENYIRTLGENAVLMLYGNEISGSVSAFETYASCRFAYFLQYGLRLSEREEYRFAVNDFGTVLHAVLEDVSKKVTDQKKSFSLLTEDERRKLVSDSIIRITQDYGNTILKDSSRNEFMIKRMSDLADRTVWAIGKQLECGEFAPDAFEMKFVIDEEEVQAGKRMSVMGKIDRIDICEDDENVYVKVIDYKSGNSDFDLLRTYYGLKLQLVTYMKAATHIEQLRHPDKRIVPAGIFYYHIDNPVIDMADLPLDNENQEREDNELDAVNIKIQEALRMKGVVNDNPSIIRKMDDTDGKSLAIPVVFKSNGELDARQSRVMSTEKFGVLEDFVTEKSVDMTSGIFQGSIEINPYESGTRNSCEYCPYGAVCGFTTDMQGSTYRHMKKFQDGELWKNIMEGVDENGRQLDNRSKKGN